MELIEEDLKKESIDLIAEEIHACAVRHGWWDGGDRNDAECICLMHSELSEALEALRKGNPPDEHCPDFDSLTVELADCVIRIMDYCVARGLPLSDAILAKMKANESRPYRHGKKF